MAESPAAAPARERIVTVLATQLHQDRRSLLRGSAFFTGANLALAVWLLSLLALIRGTGIEWTGLP